VRQRLLSGISARALFQTTNVKQGLAMIHLDYIRAKLASAAMWRATLTMKYPGDLRNGAAYHLLKSLATLPVDLDAETKAKLAEFHGPEFVTAVQAACREVCFRYEPRTLQEVAERVIELMNVPAAPSPAEALFAQVQR
jgi:hypothetical protein